MKIPFGCSTTHDPSKGLYFYFDGSQQAAQNLEPQLKDEFPAFRGFSFDGNPHAVFDPKVDNRTLCRVQVRLNQHPELECEPGFLNPPLVGWGWAIKQYGFKFVLFNIPAMLSAFINCHMLLGNMGFRRAESALLVPIHLLVSLALIYWAQHWTEGWGWLAAVPIFALGVHMLAACFAMSIPKVGDVKPGKFADDGAIGMVFHAAFFLAILLALVLFPVTFQTWLFIPVFWAVFRALTYQSTRDYDF